jgi:DNA-binding NarL/FixJ family response regulator
MHSVPKTSVTIVHNRPVVSAGLAAVLRADDIEVRSYGAEVPQGEAAHLDCGGIVVADLDTGLRLTGGGCGCQVLIVAEQDSEASVRWALKAGVRGYLLLTSPLAAIVRAVRDVMTGGTVLDPSVASTLLASFDADRLTAREIDVLRLMMRGLSNQAIASQLHRSIETVKAHVRAILRKVNATTRTQAVAIAQRRGLVGPYDAAASSTTGSQRHNSP